MELKDKMKNLVKIKGEIPMFRRCCCCLPLRYGLLAWGYFKIVVDLCFIPILAYYMMAMIFLIGMFGRTEHLGWILLYFAVIIFAATVFLTDIIMSIVFIVGGHKKNWKLLRAYYIYNIVILALTLLLTTSSVCLSLSNAFGSETALRTWDILLLVYSAYFIIIVVQTYFTLLLRSEFIKLRNNADSFRFVNNAAEAECTMVPTEKMYPECTMVPTEKVYPSIPTPDTEPEDV